MSIFRRSTALPPEFFAFVQMSKCLDPSRSRRNAVPRRSRQSVSLFDYFTLLSYLLAPFISRPYGTFPSSKLMKSPIPLIHPSVYLSLWFALVSRSQVSLINFVASLCGAGGIQAFKTMRTLRALRPLRAMSRMQGMRVCNPPSQQTLSLAIYVCPIDDGRVETSSSPPSRRHSTYPSIYVQFRYQFWSNIPFDYVNPANTSGECNGISDNEYRKSVH